VAGIIKVNNQDQQFTGPASPERSTH